MKKSVEHLETLDKVFSKFNYPEKKEYLRNRRKINRLNKTFPELFTSELYYGDDGRQMILNDILEYIFSARGYYYMWKSADIEKKRIFVKIILYFINQLMIFESISVNYKLRNQVLKSLRKKIGESNFFLNEESKIVFKALKRFKGDVHFDTSERNVVSDSIVEYLDVSGSDSALKWFDSYSDSLLPKLPHGLWRELIVYIQLLRINAGYVLPLLLNQRVISKTGFLKPPDFLVIREDGRLVGVEVGGGKETQSGNFSAKLGCQMVTAQNTNIPPRCPICGKWILFCDKVIEDFADLENPLYYIYDDIRCAHDCNVFSYDQVLAGQCPYIKYWGKISNSTKPKQKIKYSSNYHYHYSCILKTNDSVALSEIEKKKTRWEEHLKRRGTIENTSPSKRINCLKTNYPYFDGLQNLRNDTKENLSCFAKYLGNKNCELCDFAVECERWAKLDALLDATEKATGTRQ